MSVWLVLILAGFGWLIGPLALQAAGAIAILLALIVLGIEPGGSTVGGVGLGVIGALLVYVGAVWRTHREQGTSTVAGRWVREQLAREILRRNPHGRFQQRLAYRIAWRLPHWRLDRLCHEAEHVGEAPADDDTAEKHSLRMDDDPVVAFREWFDAEHPASRERYRWWEYAPEGSVRAETNDVLEEIRRHLAKVIGSLFYHEIGPDWRNKLGKRRQSRLGWDGRLFDYTKDAFADCEILFSTIAEDWTMIGACFMGDPSPAANTLVGILDSYRHDGPHDGDSAKATQAFREIVDAIRPQFREKLKEQFSAARAGYERRQRQYAQRKRETVGS